VTPSHFPAGRPRGALIALIPAGALIALIPAGALIAADRADRR